MNKENQVLDLNSDSVPVKQALGAHSPTRLTKHIAPSSTTVASSSNIHSATTQPAKSCPIFDKSVSRKFILRGTTLSYDLVVDGGNVGGVIDLIDSKISFGAPFKSTMENGKSRFLYPFTILSRGKQHVFWAVSDKLRRSSMLILHEQSQTLKSVRPHLRPNEEVVGFGALTRVKSIILSSNAHLCVSNAPRLLVVDPTLNTLLEQSSWSAKSPPVFLKVNPARFKVMVEGGKEYVFEDTKSGSNYWEEVFRTLSISLSRSQPYRSPARHLGAPRASPLRRATPSPLRPPGRGSSRNPSPAVRRPVVVTPTRAPHSAVSADSNKQLPASLIIPAAVLPSDGDISVPSNSEQETSTVEESVEEIAVAEEANDKISYITTYECDDATIEPEVVAKWQLPSELIAPESENTPESSISNAVDASEPPILSESNSMPDSSHSADVNVSSSSCTTASPSVVVTTPFKTTPIVAKPTDGSEFTASHGSKLSLHNVLYYGSFVVFVVTAGALNSINAMYSRSPWSGYATATTASVVVVATTRTAEEVTSTTTVTSRVADEQVSVIPSLYMGPVSSDTCSVSEILTTYLNTCDESEFAETTQSDTGLGFSVNRYRALRLNPRNEWTSNIDNDEGFISEYDYN